MLLAIYNCLMIPFVVAFEPPDSETLNGWERFVDVSFGLDIIVNFRCTYVNLKTGFEICTNREVTMNYIKTGRFFVDLAASIPFELLIQASD